MNKTKLFLPTILMPLMDLTLVPLVNKLPKNPNQPMLILLLLLQPQLMYLKIKIKVLQLQFQLQLPPTFLPTKVLTPAKAQITNLLKKLKILKKLKKPLKLLLLPLLLN
jgi:hypothetical protein